MAGIVATTPAASSVRPRTLVYVEARQYWSEDWSPAPELEPITWTRTTAAAGVGTCKLRYRYGVLKDAHESTLGTRGPILYVRWWVRLRMLGDSGIETVWQGQVQAITNDAMGATDSTPRGAQALVAYDAMAILERMDISESYWSEGGALSGPLAWMPGVNLRGRGGVLAGNRSSAVQGNTYVYGGTSTWTYRQYIDYLLEHFVNDSSDSERPTFTLGGQVDILDDLTAPVPLRQVENARSLLGKLIPTEFGIDCTPVPTADGWELRIFALTDLARSFAGATIPVNSSPRVTINAATEPDLPEGGCIIEYSEEQQYDRIRVIGERIVVVGTLEVAGGELEPKWTAAQETAYLAGVAGTAAENDLARKADDLDGVFRAFGASDTWDHDSGLAAPAFDLDGNLNASSAAARQTSDRETMPRLPLREGWDYTSDPPVDGSASGYEAEFRKPFAFCYREFSGTGYYVMLDKLTEFAEANGLKAQSMGLSVLDHEWGVILTSVVGHQLAENHWSGANESNFDPDTDGLDYDNLGITIAWKSDQRLALGLDVPDAFKGHDGSTKTIEVPGAECWVLAPLTCIDIQEGEQVSSPATHVVIRNDASKLALIAAGALSRYTLGRVRLRLNYSTLKPCGSLVGSIIAVSNTGDAAIDATGGIVTSVEWSNEADNGRGATIVKAGYV